MAGLTDYMRALTGGYNSQALAQQALASTRAEMASPSVAVLDHPPFPTRRDLPEPAPVDLSGLDRELADEVAKVFGYTTPQKAIEAKEAEARLTNLLRGLGIKPFVKEEVKKYQQEVREQHTKSNRVASWERIELGRIETRHHFGMGGPYEYKWSYDKPIPQFALHTALRLKKAEPDATIHIDYLDVRPADPFMVVRLGPAEEYVEVWDEADFNGQRQA